jgi:hypothetical protein
MKQDRRNYVHTCMRCDKFILEGKNNQWPLCEIHQDQSKKDNQRPKCPKCDKYLRKCDFMMTGIHMKCFVCNNTLWHKKLGYV